MTAVGHVRELWRYPASSLGGERCDTLAVGPLGAEGDRLYGLIDAATGEITRPDRDRKWHGVPRIRTRLAQRRRLEIAVPGDDRWLPAPGAEADRAASAFLGFAASILPLTGEAAAVGGGPSIEARYRKAPIHLLTTASLARLEELHPGGVADPRRFRPNILVEMPAVDGSFPETGWIGTRIAIGELTLRVSEPCRRCGFTIIAQDGFVDDPDILRTLVRHNRHNLGVYCEVEQAGGVAVGDEVRRL